MDLIIFIIIVIICILYSKKKKYDEYQQQIAHMKQFSIDCSKQANRQLLSRHGDKMFIAYYGQEQYDQIKNNKDTDIVKLKK